MGKSSSHRKKNSKTSNSTSSPDTSPSKSSTPSRSGPASIPIPTPFPIAPFSGSGASTPNPLPASSSADPSRLRRASQLSPPPPSEPITICTRSPPTSPGMPSLTPTSEHPPPTRPRRNTSPVGPGNHPNVAHITNVRYIHGRADATLPAGTPPVLRGRSEKEVGQGPMSYAAIAKHTVETEEEGEEGTKHEREAAWLPDVPSAKKPKLSRGWEGGVDERGKKGAEAIPRSTFSFSVDGEEGIDGLSNVSAKGCDVHHGKHIGRADVLSLLADRDATMMRLTQRVEALEWRVDGLSGGGKVKEGVELKTEKIGGKRGEVRTVRTRYMEEEEGGMLPRWIWWGLGMVGAGIVGGLVGVKVESGRLREGVADAVWRATAP